MIRLKTIKVQEFWVTNFSSMNVTLSDLAINIKSYTSVNLLDKKHYSLTLEQLEKSKENGSIFNKRDKITIRHLGPEPVEKETLPFRKEEVMPTRARSILVIKNVEYDELKISDDKEVQKKMDEELAQENADISEGIDPTVVIKKK